MPLDIIGSIAASGSSGASTRTTARVSDQDFAAASARNAAALAHSDTAPKEEVQVSAPNANVAVFVSPFIRYDISARLAIVEIRNSETGEVQQQYPSPRAVREYQQNLPEASDLRSQGESKVEAEPRVTGNGGTPAAQNTAPAATPPAAQGATASTAAFSNLQGIPTGGKQVTVV